MNRMDKHARLLLAVILLLAGIMVACEGEPVADIPVPVVTDNAQRTPFMPAPVPGDPEVSVTPYPIRPDLQVFPPEIQVFDPAFEEVYKKFTDAVTARDFTAIEGFLYPETATSHYPDDPKGFEEFFDYWNIFDDSENLDSEIWPVLDEIIRLGGIYSTEEKSFQAPYTWFSTPEEYREDTTSCFVVTGGQVDMFQEKSFDSPVVTQLAYHIVYLDKGEREFYLKTDEDFVKVVMPSGLSGYVQRKHIRYLADYRMELREVDGHWRLTYLLYGVG